jgi:uncharacterized membrane protein
MAEAKGNSTPKPRIETLSDLIFGLALSIGALTLIGQPATNFLQLLQFLLFYAFSFIILISVWYSYTRNMALLKIEHSKLLTLNILLLFLVSIEPFLFNQLFQADAALIENVSILYALDLGGLFLIQAFFIHAIVSEKQYSADFLRGYRLRRNTILLSSAFFFVSILPFFWTWNLTISSGIGVPFRVIMWLIPLALPSIRRWWEKRTQKPVK